MTSPGEPGVELVRLPSDTDPELVAEYRDAMLRHLGADHLASKPIPEQPPIRVESFDVD